MAGMMRAAQLADNAFAADAESRAKIASNFFDEATVNAKFAAGAIDTDRLKQGGEFVQRDGSVTMTGALAMGSQKITGLADGSATSDAATYGQLQAVSAGLDPKESCRAATTEILDNNTDISGSPSYNNTGGSSSRGQITATLAVSDTFAIDGVAIADGDRVLIKNEGDGSGLGGDANGIYVAGISGTALTLDRADDFDEDDEVTAGAFSPVEEGTENGDTLFLLTTNDPITIGGASGTSLTFASFGTFDLGGTPSTIEPDATASEGVSTDAARADHTHAIVAAAPSTNLDGDTTNAEGSSTSFSRADHAHGIDTAAPSTALDGDTTNAEGSAAGLARADHAHAITTAAPSTALDKTSTNAEGSAAGLARADHSHEVTFPKPTSSNKDQTPAATAGDDSTTGLTMAATPAKGHYVQVKVNGIQYPLGDGVKSKACYFSGDGGSTARAHTAIQSGDTLYWNGATWFNLITADRVDFDYLV